MTTQLTYENPITTAINDHLYPATSLYIPLVPPPQQQQQQPGGVVKQRRRRRKTKNSEGMGQKKRKLSEEQVVMLENSFGSEHKLESERKDKLALELGLDPRQVAVWFQNRRARWKNKKLEDEFSKLNSQHHSTLLEKCNLEAQVMKLKEELKDAQMEIKRLSERAEMITCSTINSPTSSMSMDHAIDPCMIVGDYANLHGFNDLVYFQGESLVESLGWNLYNM